MITAILQQLKRDSRGTSAVEMGLICALIVLAMLTALQGVGNETKNTWTKIRTDSANAIAAA